MRRSVALSLAWFLAMTASAGADEPLRGAPPGLAARVWCITDAVLDHHIEPPTRQAMIAAGLTRLDMLAAVRPAGRKEPRVDFSLVRRGPLGVARETVPRIPAITSREQLADALDEAWGRIADDADAAPPPTPEEAPIGRFRGERPRTPEDALIDGVLSAVPGYARLVSEQEDKVSRQLAGNTYVGLQVNASFDNEARRVKIERVLEGGPAQRAGVRPGDLVDEIDGVSAEGLTSEEVLDRIRGPLGSVVALRLRQSGSDESRFLKVTRGLLPRRTVAGIRNDKDGTRDVMIKGDGRIAYLKVVEIVGSTPHELRTLARRLRADGARALILDLRSVTRADLHSAVLLADSLLEEGRIGRLRTAHGVETFKATPGALFLDTPLAVLIDHNTTGPAEWLAAALQDNRRAVVVGVRTGASTNPHARNRIGFESGVRTTVPLLGDGGGKIVLKTGLLERGDGRLLAPPSSTGAPMLDRNPPDPGDGVTPDVPGLSGFSELSRAIDPNVSGDATLAAALKHLRKEIKLP